MVNDELIKEFLEGRDPQNYIVGIESTYDDNFVQLIINDPETGKRIEKHRYKPFLWMKYPDVDTFYGGNRKLIKSKMREYLISIKSLRIENDNGDVDDRLDNGFKFLVETKGPYKNIIRFFRDGGIDIRDEKYRKSFLTVGTSEQFLIQTSKRLFKGFEDYDDLVRFCFDIETTSLNPEDGRIFQIGMKDNRGFEHVLTIDSEDQERNAILTFFDVINEIKPDIIGGYNSENFDWSFILKRSEILGLDPSHIAKTLKKGMPLYRKKATLKMGAEMEYYDQTVMWGYNIMDIWHAVRRAKAINSNIKETGLKYITKYSKVNKPNRVYIDHNMIKKLWESEDVYMFNDSTGKYIKKSNFVESDTTNWSEVDGKYIVTRYLLDDLWETEKIDYIYNQATFLLSKILPSTLQRTATMGTAAQWKILMCAWSYENGLAIPDYQPKQTFPGGLSRLLKVGFVKNVVKLDYGSLYPSIQLSHDVFPSVDITGALKGMLNYLFNARDLYKGLMKKAAKEGNESEASKYDKKQLPIKILNNSNFGSVSAPDVYPWGDILVGSLITCTGRQYLRLMIKFFMSKGFEPIVGDSITGDTPIYIKYDNGDIDIVPIEDIFNPNGTLEGDDLRDYSDKPYQILTRSGWKNIKYVYKHPTDKKIHRIQTKDRLIDVTEDHSLFKDGVEIKPSELKEGDTIDIYDITLNNHNNNISEELAWVLGFFIGDGSCVYKKRTVKYKSKKDGTIHLNKGVRSELSFHNQNLEYLDRCSRVMKNEFGLELLLKDYMSSSGVYKLRTHNVNISKKFRSMCYTANGEKRTPIAILNSNSKVKKAFIDGLCASDGWGNDLENLKMIGLKSKVCMASIFLIFKELGINFRIKTRKDKTNFISFNLGEKYKINDLKSKRKTNVVSKNEIINNSNNNVYDVSTEDGTFIAGIGGIIAHNTDGFNFKIPDDIDNIKYVGKGTHSTVEKDKEYVGIDACVAEYNELYMRGVMKLGVDEIIESTINISRKNYADLIDGEIKLVGNTIKSTKLPIYIEEFLDKGIRLLLEGNGVEFIESYYEYIDQIYNQEIPLVKIASKSKVKQTLSNYIDGTKKKNKAGNPMPRQAHMELLIKDDIKVNLGDVIYYVNTGTKKSHADVKATRTKDGEIKIEFNSKIIPTSQIESDPGLKGEYNTSKYISAFNKRIEPLLVCFNPEIRNKILIENPSKRQYFTESQLELCSGMPDSVEDQDTLDDVFIMEQKEIDFWEKVGIDPEFMYVKDNTTIIEGNKKEEENEIEYF